MRRVMTALLAVMILAIGAVPSAFAADVIAPETVVADSDIGTFNLINNIISHSIGSDDDGSGDLTLIQPTTVIEGVRTNLLNVINTIVNINVDVSDLGSMISDMRSDITEKLN